MAQIDQYLTQIRSAVYGRDVRSAIANGIQLCYSEMASRNGVTISMLGDYVTKTSLNSTLGSYLTKTDAGNTYATQYLVQNSYLSKTDASNTYATKAALGSYLTIEGAKASYITSDGLNSKLKSYLTSSDAKTTYLSKNDADNSYLAKTDAEATYVKKTKLLSEIGDYYLTPDKATATYVKKTDLTSTLGDYLTVNDAASGYASKEDLGSYLTVESASGNYATKTQLLDYVLKASLDSYSTTAQIENRFVTKVDLANDYVTKTALSSTHPNFEYLTQNFVSNTALDQIHSFEYILSEGLSPTIPNGVENVNGVIGSMAASADTMYKIYMVEVRDKIQDKYDGYITLKLSTGEYVWEKLGGGSGGTIEIIDGSGETVDLSDYITYREADATYAKISALANFVSKNYVDDSIITALTPYLTKEDAASQFIPAGSVKGFDYVICLDSFGAIPEGVTNYAGTTGVLAASDATMYRIYFVQMKNSGENMYAGYITLKNGGSYYWQRIGSDTTDLSIYLKSADAAETYVTKVDAQAELNKYLTQEAASQIYIQSTTLANYATQQYVDTQLTKIATNGQIDLSNYLTKDDASKTYVAQGQLVEYATRTYAETLADLTNNDLFMLEVEEIPGTTQEVSFDTDGNIKMVEHKQAYDTVRTDKFTFSGETITEIRTLNNTKATLTIVTNTDTLAVETTYQAAA